MSVIRIDPGDVQRVEQDFRTTRDDVDRLIGRAKTMMGNLQGQFTGQRASRIFSEWEGMQGNLKSAVGTLEQARALLEKAARDFIQVDEAR